MEERDLKWLEINELKILKQIIIISDRKNGETEIGSVIYTRPITNEYNIKKQEEKETHPLSLSIKQYPQQKNFPNDGIDEIIFKAIENSFPKSTVRNDTILFNLDLDKISILKKRRTIPSSIYFTPNLSKIGNLFSFVGKDFKVLKLNINVYGFYKPEFLVKYKFFAEYDATEENILDDLKTIKFE